MPPKKKARKRETTPLVPSGPKDSLTDPQDDGGQNIAFEGPVPGFLRLPVELFEMVLAELDMFTEDDVLSNPQFIPAERCHHLSALRALSQTSRALKGALLPLAWEHFEACTTKGEGLWYKKLASRLEGGSKMLAENPALAKHVKIVSVTLTRCSTNTVIPAFVRCLKLLPNLHTLYVVHAHSQMTTALKNGFGGHSIPQIKTLIVPSCAHEILRSCTGVTRVTCNEDSGGKLVAAIGAGCPDIQALIHIHPDGAIFKRLGKATPNLRELHITKPGQPDDLRLLSALKSLSTVRIDAVRDFSSNQQECFDVLREVLKQNDSKEKKQICVYYYSYVPHWGAQNRTKHREIEVIDVE